MERCIHQWLAPHLVPHHAHEIVTVARRIHKIHRSVDCNRSNSSHQPSSAFISLPYQRWAAGWGDLSMGRVRRRGGRISLRSLLGAGKPIDVSVAQLAPDNHTAITCQS